MLFLSLMVIGRFYKMKNIIRQFWDNRFNTRKNILIWLEVLKVTFLRSLFAIMMAVLLFALFIEPRLPDYDSGDIIKPLLDVNKAQELYIDQLQQENKKLEKELKFFKSELNNYLDEEYKGKEDIRGELITAFEPYGLEAVKWALFTANWESSVGDNPHNWSDDHTSWCKGDRGKGSHGLFHFNKCTYEALGGMDIMNPHEQIKIASKLYDKRYFYWVNTTAKFEGRL